MTAETRADGIRHLAGLAGRFPSDALERARKAVGSLVGDAVVAVDGQELIVAAGPATHLDGRTGSALCIVAGPLYDRAELAASLGLPRGTEPDRLVGAAFERWGEEVLTHLRTEGTILVWDRARHRGFVACDPLGASSLFWCREGGAVAFASELRILLALLRRRPAPDPVGIAHWLRRTASRPDLTLYESVAQLRVGHRLRLASEGAAVEPYWRPTYEPPEPLTMEDAVELVRPALRRAVERRLAPAGPTGILLSGGLDSTAAAGAARAAQAEIRGYSAVFPGRPKLDESAWIDDMAAFAGFPVVRLTPEPTGLLADTLEFVRNWAAPPDGWGVWNRILFQQAVDDGVSAFLTGELAEALFDVRFSLVGDRLRAGRLVEAFRLTRQVPFGFLYPSPRTVLGVLRNSVLPAAAPTVGSRLEAARDGRHQPRWLRAEFVRPLRDTAGQPPWREFDAPAWWRRPAYDLTVVFPAMGLLQYLRRRGETFGISTRTPYIDLDLVRLGLRLPPELGFNAALTKPLLRAVSQGQVPDSVRLRPMKTLWNTLVTELVAGDDWPAVRRLLSDPSAEISQFVHHDLFVRDMLEDTSEGGRAFPWAPDLIQFVGLEIWLRQEAGRSL